MAHLGKFDVEYLEELSKRLAKDYEAVSDTANGYDHEGLYEVAEHLSKALKYVYQTIDAEEKR